MLILVQDGSVFLAKKRPWPIKVSTRLSVPRTRGIDTGIDILQNRGQDIVCPGGDGLQEFNATRSARPTRAATACTIAVWPDSFGQFAEFREADGSRSGCVSIQLVGLNRGGTLDSLIWVSGSSSCAVGIVRFGLRADTQPRGRSVTAIGSKNRVTFLLVTAAASIGFLRGVARDGGVAGRLIRRRRRGDERRPSGIGFVNDRGLANRGSRWVKAAN